MMNASKLGVVLLAAGLSVGCASKSDFDQLKTRVDGLEQRLGTVEAKADDAAAAAARAEDAANKAAASAARTEAMVSERLDRGFKRGAMK